MANKCITTEINWKFYCYTVINYIARVFKQFSKPNSLSNRAPSCTYIVVGIIFFNVRIGFFAYSVNKNDKKMATYSFLSF